MQYGLEINYKGAPLIGMLEIFKNKKYYKVWTKFYTMIASPCKNIRLSLLGTLKVSVGLALQSSNFSTNKNI